MAFGRKYSAAMQEEMCALIRENDITLRDMLVKVGISFATYYDWRENRSGFAKDIDEAQAERLQKIKIIARNSLITLLTGRVYTETTKIYSIKGKGKNVVKKLTGEKHITKFVLPNVTAVLTTLRSLDPDNFMEIAKAVQPQGALLNGPAPLNVQVLNTAGIDILEVENPDEE